MCDICGDIIALLQIHDNRTQENVGHQLSKDEIFIVASYTSAWQSRQCMCVFKSPKNFERLNSLVQVILSQAITIIPTLPEDCVKEKEQREKDDELNKLDKSDPETVVETTDGAKNSDVTEGAGTGSEHAGHNIRNESTSEESQEQTKGNGEKREEKEEGMASTDGTDHHGSVDHDSDEVEHWSIEEKEQLLVFISKLYLVNFPLYMAYKHSLHTSLEEMSQQETSALNSYCDLTFQDGEIPVYLLRNVCFFCDSNGMQALKGCFEKSTPDTLSIPLVHTLVNIIANLRLWMNVSTVVQYIIPLKPPIVRYMCQLSDKDLRLAGNRNLTDLLWTALREPMETNTFFDRDGLELAFKYYTCTTLTLRLTGIAQINNYITNYNEIVNSENLVEPENVGCQLADWLAQNKIIQHIFGPNLHVEIIKQSQIVLNFLAIESRINEEHIDSIWAAAQLKHCSRQVQDLLIALIKNLEINLVQYLLKLVSGIEPQAHNEQTLFLACALTKAVWSRPLPSQSHVTTLTQQTHQSFTALTREQEELGKGVLAKHAGTSSDETETSEEEMEEDHSEVDHPHKSQLEQCDCGQHHAKQRHHGHHHRRPSRHGHDTSNSGLSNASDDSLHSGIFEEGEFVTGHGHMAEGDVVSGEEGEKTHALHQHMLQRVARQHLEEEEDEEDEDESWDEDEELDTDEDALTDEALLYHHKKQHGHYHRHHHHQHHQAVDTEEECSASELDSGQEQEVTGEQSVPNVSDKQGQPKVQKQVSPKDLNESANDAEKPDEEVELSGKVDEAANTNTTGDGEREMLKRTVASGVSEQGSTTGVKGNKKVRKLMPKSVAERKRQFLLARLKKHKEQSRKKEKLKQCKEANKPCPPLKKKKAVIPQEAVPPDGQSTPDGEETEVYDCRPYIEELESSKDKSQDDFEDILSPEGSFNSSRGSTKSEKNMADFEGEVSDEELLAAHYKHHHHVRHVSPVYHPHLPTVVESCSNEVEDEAEFDGVCGPGKTLLWDLVQEETAPLLQEGLALEAEKILCSLVCYSTNRHIRMKFIEACVKNISLSRSVVISLRLLPKLFGSFEPHTVTMWAEKELGMMTHFFNNLCVFKDKISDRSFPGTGLYSFKEEVYVRLEFLTCMYSTLATPEDFTMSLQQVDILWNSLVTDPDSSDECLNWFLNQAKTKDHHALKLETFKHLFVEKMSSLQPETMSMVGLSLFQQLCHLARCHNASLDNPVPEEQISGMDQLWGIALRANNTDVSMSAIQYINHYYIGFGGGNLNKENEFIQRCMHSLMSASELPEDQSPATNLLVIQRALVLLRNHLEGFRRRFAFHLRTWQLDGRPISSHQVASQGKTQTQIRVLLQPAGMPDEKATLELNSSDMVGELRAEVSRWWLAVQKRQRQLHQQQEQLESGTRPHVSSTPLLGALLGDGPIRMITLGQELGPESDEKALNDAQIKDHQTIIVSAGANRSQRPHSTSTPACYLSAPDQELTPMMILLEKPYFEQLFGLLQLLSNMKCTTEPTDTQERSCLENKARILSRKVWELLMLLPTNPRILEGFQALVVTEAPGSDGDASWDWNSLLDPHNAHKLMYSLQVVEFLSKIPKQRRRSLVVRSGGGDSILASTDSEMSVDLVETPEEIWRRKFISKGGLSHLFNIFVLGSLQIKDGDHWSEWKQECLAYLLRLVSLFAVTPTDDVTHDEVFESNNYESPRKRMRKNRSNEKVIVPLNQTILSMMKVEPVLKILTTILYDAALPSFSEFGQMQTWGRAEVIHYAMSFLVSWAYSCNNVIPALCMMDNCSDWLKRLTVDAPEPNVRCEACKGLYKLCLGRTTDGKSGYKCLLPFVSHMLGFLPAVLKIKVHHEDSEYEPKEKEPVGPGCRDYFWLLSGLVENISKEDISQCYEQDNLTNLNSLAVHITKCIHEREFYETRYSMTEDHVLIGLLQLCTVVMKLNPPFKYSQAGQDFLLELFWYLFALPSPNQRHLPKCKSQAARSATYDLIVELTKGNLENYTVFHAKLLEQHTKDSHSPYPWEHWPHEDGRSNCGYVGLTNLGATCYLATCMQHLYMIPQARQSVLQAKGSKIDIYEGMLVELQKMFAYLLESERKAYNPKSFCKVYTMDKQPLNTGEQKDMTEFFTDLISKLEDVSPDLKKQVKGLFGGVLTNNVVSLDCPHVSRTLEEFYTVRCQVADMKNLYESLDEVTVKDTLEGDNMYTCSTCQKKVRAEKRACFKKLPKILCFNTMRYTFNMLTMMKEKVNTHFSFPLHLDMSDYMERNLMKPDKLEEEESTSTASETSNSAEECYEFELIGVTVHTGTADGGHYYSFIRDRINKPEKGPDKWFLFNDAEVKPFDATQIASECFGGEMMSKTYDSMTDKYMDFSFEKTNSAYMLFYERISRDRDQQTEDSPAKQTRYNFELSKELADWIWQDNMHFLQDKNVFEHTYFSFMWQMCGFIPTTLPKDDPQTVSIMVSQLSTSFVLETFIHAKEKPTMLQWIELLTKQFNSCQAACEWFLDHMSKDDCWPQQILIRCPNQVVRKMFQRLVIHVFTQLRPAHVSLYLHPLTESTSSEIDTSKIGDKSCVTRFIKKMLTIIEHGVNNQSHSKYLAEYFDLLFEFAKQGDVESLFLIHIHAISTMVNFYMTYKTQESYVELSDDDEDEDVIPLAEDKFKPIAFEKMISLISLLVESSRGDEKLLSLPEQDYSSIIGRGKGFNFLFHQIKDSINLHKTCSLIFSLCRWNDRLAMTIIQMIFSAITKLNSDQSQPFFRLLTLLTEFVGGPPGHPPFTNFILQKFWDLTDFCPQQCLDWLSTQVTRNKVAHSFVMQSLEMWVEQYLIAHSNLRVRNAASYLLVSLVPSQSFRQASRNGRSIISPHKELQMSSEAIHILHKVYEHLLRLLKTARMYADAAVHDTTSLVAYFALLTVCLVSKTEKLMFSPYFLDLWQLFQPKLSEPPIAVNHNKQALLVFWYQVCIDCPENVKLIVSNNSVTKNIAFNYILADHEDQDVVLHNRCMLPAYYGILRLCCQQSRSFTRQLAQHQNIQWAFKNITPYIAQYTSAVEELFRIMRLMVTQYDDSSEDELKAITQFKKSTILLYLQSIEARAGWQTLVTALKILVDSTDDRLLLVFNQGLQMFSEAFSTVYAMYHEATACHVTSELIDLLSLLTPVLKVARHQVEKRSHGVGSETKACLMSWKERMELTRKLLTLLNSYNPSEVRQASLDTLKEMVMNYQSESVQAIVPFLYHNHSTFQESNTPVSCGPFFPRRGQKLPSSKSNVRPARPQFHMMLRNNQLECAKGIDDDYDSALHAYFSPYHVFVDFLCRMAVNQKNVNETIVNLSALVAYEAVPLHSLYFPKLWNEIYHSEHIDKSCIDALCNSSYFIDYVDAVLLDERQSLNNPIIYQFFCNFFPKVHGQVLNDQGSTLLDSLLASLTSYRSLMEEVETDGDICCVCQKINGDLRAMMIIFSVRPPRDISGLLHENLQFILDVCHDYQKQRAARLEEEQRAKEECCEDTSDDADEVPTKKQKLDSDENQPSTSSSEEESTKPNKDKDDDDEDGDEDNKPKSAQQTITVSDDSVEKPSSSKESIHKDNGKDGSRQPKTKVEGTSRRSQSEKSNTVDMTVKHISTIYSLVKTGNSDRESSET